MSITSQRKWSLLGGLVFVVWVYAAHSQATVASTARRAIEDSSPYFLDTVGSAADFPIGTTERPSVSCCTLMPITEGLPPDCHSHFYVETKKCNQSLIGLLF